MKTKLIWRFISLLILAGIITYSLSPVLSFQNPKFKLDTLVNLNTILDKEIPRLMNSYDIPGVIIAHISNGKPVWRKAYGYADVEAGRRMTTDTYCRMESISKSLTAWGVMKLVEERKIHLDTPINRYIRTWTFPKSLFKEELVTPRLLLSHTAGLQLGTIGERYAPTDLKPTLQEILSKDAVLQEEPGKRFSYSNTGFIVLELLIEEITQMSFSNYMEQEILLPLGMKQSSFEWKPAFSPPVATGYDARGNPIPVYVYPDKAAGGLFATLDDMIVFVSAGFFAGDSQNILNRESINTIYAPHTEIPGLYGFAFEHYGLGHFIDQLAGEQRAISHGGQGTGWMTQFYSVPSTGDGLIILSNSQRSWPFFGAILNEWGNYEGYDSIGMGAIVLAAKVVWLLFGLLVFLWLWKIWSLTENFLQHKRIFAPLSSNQIIKRLIYLFIFFALSAIFTYALTTNYFEPASLFPVALEYIGYLTVLYLLLLLSLILFPVREKYCR